MIIGKIETTIELEGHGIVVTRTARMLNSEKITTRNVIDMRLLLSIIGDGDYFKMLFETNIEDIKKLTEVKL